ncbi:hypothetical protein K491DRAFT_756890 [Lophiostoma macrostomum CBS 122681]|uniref:Uncharacterized protein n=1 Tax=Lophiostoma macrostomum CBS 122681 TaxID=1314788 RepID=A0A6A6TF07_9PLEO|nr:hypothetical protein K491DRAFT_756890 [Lophiostoma macrostomum CBS 122681]
MSPTGLQTSVSRTPPHTAEFASEITIPDQALDPPSSTSRGSPSTKQSAASPTLTNSPLALDTPHIDSKKQPASPSTTRASPVTEQPTSITTPNLTTTPPALDTPRTDSAKQPASPSTTKASPVEGQRTTSPSSPAIPNPALDPQPTDHSTRLPPSSATEASPTTQKLPSTSAPAPTVPAPALDPQPADTTNQLPSSSATELSPSREQPTSTPAVPLPTFTSPSRDSTTQPPSSSTSTTTQSAEQPISTSTSTSPPTPASTSAIPPPTQSPTTTNSTTQPIPTVPLPTYTAPTLSPTPSPIPRPRPTPSPTLNTPPISAPFSTFPAALYRHRTTWLKFVDYTHLVILSSRPYLGTKYAAAVHYAGRSATVREYLVLLSSLSESAPPEDTSAGAGQAKSSEGSLRSRSGEEGQGLLRELRIGLDRFTDDGDGGGGQGKGHAALLSHLAHIGRQLGISETSEALHEGSTLDTSPSGRSLVNREAVAHLKGCLDGFEKRFDERKVRGARGMDRLALGYLKGVVDGLEKRLEGAGNGGDRDVGRSVSASAGGGVGVDIKESGGMTARRDRRGGIDDVEWGGVPSQGGRRGREDRDIGGTSTEGRRDIPRQTEPENLQDPTGEGNVDDEMRGQEPMVPHSKSAMRDPDKQRNLTGDPKDRDAKKKVHFHLWGSKDKPDELEDNQRDEHNNGGDMKEARGADPHSDQPTAKPSDNRLPQDERQEENFDQRVMPRLRESGEDEWQEERQKELDSLRDPKAPQRTKDPTYELEDAQIPESREKSHKSNRDVPSSPRKSADRLDGTQDGEPRAQRDAPELEDAEHKPTPSSKSIDEPVIAKSRLAEGKPEVLDTETLSHPNEAPNVSNSPQDTKPRETDVETSTAGDMPPDTEKPSENSTDIAPDQKDKLATTVSKLIDSKKVLNRLVGPIVTTQDKSEGNIENEKDQAAPTNTKHDVEATKTPPAVQSNPFQVTEIFHQTPIEVSLSEQHQAAATDPKLDAKATKTPPALQLGPIQVTEIFHQSPVEVSLSEQHEAAATDPKHDAKATITPPAVQLGPIQVTEIFHESPIEASTKQGVPWGNEGQDSLGNSARGVDKSGKGAASPLERKRKAEQMSEPTQPGRVQTKEIPHESPIKQAQSEQEPGERGASNNSESSQLESNADKPKKDETATFQGPSSAEATRTEPQSLEEKAEDSEGKDKGLHQGEKQQRGDGASDPERTKSADGLSQPREGEQKGKQEAQGVDKEIVSRGKERVDDSEDTSSIDGLGVYTRERAW